MTCSRRLGRTLQASSLALIGMLTIVGCGGSDTTTKPDAGKDATSAIDGPGGNPGKLTVTPSFLDFQTVDVGATSTAQTITLTVSGANVAISPTIVGAGFALAGNTCAASQAPGTCTISVKFAPNALGAANGVLTVGGATVSLSGTGNQPGLFTVPDRIDLGTLKQGATAPVTLPVSVQGSLPSLACTTSATELAVNAAATTCAATGPVSTSCVYAFTFTAATAGSRTATVTCTGGTKTAIVTVAAAVVGPSVLAVSQPSAAFSAVVNKTDTVVITVSNNGGSATATAPAATITAGATDFAVTANDCVVPLAPLATCKVTVTFAPKSAGTKSGTLSVTEGTTTLTVKLDGTATTDRSVTIAPSPGDFGSVKIKDTKALVFTMKNAGGVATGAVTLAGGSAEYVVSNDLCSGAVLAATTGQCTFTVTFIPALPAGAGHEAIITASDAAGALASVKVTGTASPAATGVVLNITPLTLDFGTTNVGVPVGPKVFTVTNAGDAASAALTVVKNDSTSSVGGAAQFLATSTCVSPLDPGASCQVTVTFAPTLAGNASATIAVTDGAVSTKASTVVGTALDKGTFTVKCQVASETASSAPDFGSVVYGKTVTASCTVDASNGKQPTGALTFAVTGDFSIPTATNTCGASMDGTTCTFKLAFTPAAAGPRTGTFTVTGAAGGVVTGNPKGVGLALVQLIPLGATASNANPSYTGLDFGMQPNATAGMVFAYRVAVRGGTDPAATSTVANVVLAAGTPADYRYVKQQSGGHAPVVWVADTGNRCNIGPTTLSLNPAAGTATPWVFNAATPASPAVAPNALVGTLPSGDDQVTNGFWTCDFYVQFNPQSGKSLTTPKTATLTATGSAGGNSVLSLTGIASGPLTINPASLTFTSPLGEISDTQTLTVKNTTGTTVTQGKLSVAFGGANAADFSVIVDGCSGKTLDVSGAGSSCQLQVAFSPSVAAAEAATITVTASVTGETATANLAGTGSPASALTVTPTAVAPASVSFGSVAQNDVGAWLTFTVTNPATGTDTGPITFSGSSLFQLYSLAVPGVTAYPAGSCGDSGSTLVLNPGKSCTVQFRLNPVVTASTGQVSGAVTGTITVAGISIPVSGTVTPQLVLTGDTISVVNAAQTLAFGDVAQGAQATKTFTITNTGASAATVKATLPSGFSFASTAGNCVDGSALAAKTPCSMSIVYSPTSATALGAITPVTIYITNGTPNDNTNRMRAPLALTANVVKPAVIDLYGFKTEYTSAIHLGAAALGTSTGVITLVFTNTGGIATTGLQATFSASSSTDFSMPAENKGTCLNIGGVLAPGATCTVNVQATPTGAVGPRTATLNVFSQGVAGTSVDLDAYGFTTSNSIYVTALAGSQSSFYTYDGSTAPAGVTQYFVLHNGTADTIDMGTSTTLFANASQTDTDTIDLELVPSYGDAHAGEFALSKPATPPAGQTCGRTLATGSCTFAVTFKPTWNANAIDELYRWAAVRIINHNVGGFPTNASNKVALGLLGRVQTPATLSLKAATAGAVTVTGGAVDFGQILQGQTPSLTFTITNTGEVATGAAVSLSLTNSGSSNYATLGASTCPAGALGPNASCTVVVNSQLPGGSAGTKTGISVKATDGTLNSSTFTLQAEFVNPASISAPAPSSTSFGSSAVGVAATPITITVSNGSSNQDTGTLGVVLSDPTNFSVDLGSTCLNSTTGAYIALTAAGVESCTVIVNFIPASAGAKSTTVTISGTPGGSPTPITLTGTGLSNLSISPTTFTSPQTFTITHSGSVTTAALREKLTGANASAFAITGDTCFGDMLTGTDQCTVEVTFIGTATSTAQTATLTVTDGTANGTATVALSVSL